MTYIFSCESISLHDDISRNRFKEENPLMILRSLSFEENLRSLQWFKVFLIIMELFNRLNFSFFSHTPFLYKLFSSKSRRLTRVDVSKTTLVRYLDGLSYPSFYPICRVLYKLGSVQKTRILRVCRYKQSQSQSLTAPLFVTTWIEFLSCLFLRYYGG